MAGERGLSETRTSEASPRSPTEPLRPILVVVAASPGATSELAAFFDHLPETPDLAFVVTPADGGADAGPLIEAVQAHAGRPCEVVRDAADVRPGVVYLPPPGGRLVVEADRLAADPSDGADGQAGAEPHDLLRAAAEHWRERAVAVWLSPHLDDRMPGLQAVREAGGVALVAAPTGALRDGLLPGAVVDRAEPACRLAAFVGAYGAHAASPAGAPPTGDEVAFEQILAHVQLRTAFEVADYERGTVVERVARRMRLHLDDSLAAYLAFLRHDDDEPRALLRDVFMPLSGFCRDPELFAVLQERLVPALFDGKGPRDEVRVWVAGCATGEEAYTAAMLLVEHARTLAEPPRLRVFGTDVSADAVKQAREGAYPASIAHDVPAAWLARHFIREGDRYRVRREIREVILFAEHDLLRVPPFSRLDLVVCRRVLQFLKPEPRARLVHEFHYALNPFGYLVLGEGEMQTEDDDAFAAVDAGQTVFRRRRGYIRRHRAVAERQADWDPPAAAAHQHHALLERYSPPSVLVDEGGWVLHRSEHAGRFLRHANDTRDVLALVDPALRAELVTVLDAALRHGRPQATPSVHLVVEGVPCAVRAVVWPSIPAGREPARALVVFESINFETIDAGTRKGRASAEAGDAARPPGGPDTTQARLDATIHEYQGAIEELKTSNEALQTTNEELRAATAELDARRDHLRQVNAQLVRMNDERQARIQALDEINSDLQNLMAATDIGIVFLDRNLCIKRFTPASDSLLTIEPDDVGRPVADVCARLGYGALVDDAREVLDRQVVLERELRAPSGRWFLVRLRPYRTRDGTADGVVLTLVDVTERRAARRALEASRAQLQALFENALDGFLLADNAMQYVDCNPAACTLLGRSRAELLQETVASVSAGDAGDAGAAVQQQWRAFLNAGSQVGEYQLRRPDGRVIDVEYRAVADILPGLHLSVLRDVTERRRREAAVRESEARFRSLFDHSPDAIFVEDLDGNILDVNPAACRLHNAEPGDLIGQHVRDLVPSSERDTVMRDFQRLVDGEASYIQSYSWVINQHAVPVEIRANRFVFGGVDAVLLIVRDVSERKQAEAELAETRARAETILETTVDAIVTIDGTGRIESVNPATERLFGYAAEELVGQDVGVLMPSPYRDEHQQYLRAYLETGEPKIIGQGREMTARRKDGSTFPVDLAVSEVHFAGRRLFSGVMRDISGRRALEQRVLQISEEERQRIGRDLHDGLGSLLTGLAMGAQGLAQARKRGQPVEAADLERLAQMVEEGASHAQALSRGLNPVKLDDKGLAAALQELAVNTRTLAQVPCFCEVDPELPRLDGHVASQLYRTAQEAVNNAVKHARPTRVAVRLRRLEDDLVLSIHDDGIGISEEARSGSGSGLHIMPYRAGLIGATYSIKDAPAGGTVVTCRLPLARAVAGVGGGDDLDHHPPAEP